jgi:two-component system sensor histidine kinase PilS (NtrC family)
VSPNRIPLKIPNLSSKRIQSLRHRSGVAAPARSSETRETLWRTLLTFNVTRVVITFVLLIYLGLSTKSELAWVGQSYYLEACVAYLVGAIFYTSMAFYFRRRFLLQLLSQLTIDVVSISILYVISGGTKSGLAILYLFPLAGSAILAPLLWALFFASSITIVLLAESSYQLFIGAPNVSISQAGLYGAAFFAAVLVVNRLADKLIAQEELAARRGKDLRVQQAINRLIIADMGDGVLVVSRDGTVLTGNPAAERMLGLSMPSDKPLYRMAEIPALMPIAEAFFMWKARVAKVRPTLENSSLFVMVKPGDDPSLQNSTTIWGGRRELTAHLKLRFAKVEEEGLTEERSVIFLQDVTEIENQAQQLKLASMGRLTASIAHEVRNPLSAISYASSLLSEEVSAPGPSRLLSIIGDNVKRLNQMIEDILSLSRKAQAHGEPLALAAFFDELLDEFRETNNVAKELIYVGDMGSYSVHFDPLHLREVLMNLLSNALRYASGADGSIRIQAVTEGLGRLELHVQDDGPAISQEVRAHLFEPFYTTSSKGTGLGLYLARELCLNNGAMLDYEYRMDHPEQGKADNMENARGRFVITLALSNEF